MLCLHSFLNIYFHNMFTKTKQSTEQSSVAAKCPWGSWERSPWWLSEGIQYQEGPEAWEEGNPSRPEHVLWQPAPTTAQAFPANHLVPLAT